MRRLSLFSCTPSYGHMDFKFDSVRVKRTRKLCNLKTSYTRPKRLSFAAYDTHVLVNVTHTPLFRLSQDRLHFFSILVIVFVRRLSVLNKI